MYSGGLGLWNHTEQKEMGILWGSFVSPKFYFTVTLGPLHIAYLFNDTDEIDIAPFLHVVLAITEDEGLRYCNVQVNKVRNNPSPSGNLEFIKSNKRNPGNCLYDWFLARKEKLCNKPQQNLLPSGKEVIRKKVRVRRNRKLVCGQVSGVKHFPFSFS